MVSTPLMALTIPVADAAALLLPLLIACDIFAVRHYWNRSDRRSVGLLLAGALPGVAVGAFFFAYFSENERALQVGMGVLALVFVLFQVVRALVLGLLEKRRPAAAAGVLMGALSGFASTLAHAGGPPVTMYLLPQKLPRDRYVGTAVMFFATLNLVKLVPYHSLGLLKVGNLLIVLVLAPLSYAGVRLGIFLNARFTDLWFNRVVYGVLFLTGLQLVLGKSLLRALLT